jgi:hypothetical protein
MTGGKGISRIYGRQAIEPQGSVVPVTSLASVAVSSALPTASEGASPHPSSAGTEPPSANAKPANPVSPLNNLASKGLTYTVDVQIGGVTLPVVVSLTDR